MARNHSVLGSGWSQSVAVPPDDHSRASALGHRAPGDTCPHADKCPLSIAFGSRERSRTPIRAVLAHRVLCDESGRGPSATGHYRSACAAHALNQAQSLADDARPGARGR